MCTAASARRMLKESIRTEESQARHSVFVQVHFGVERYVIGLGLGFVGVEEEGEEEDVDEGDEEVVGEGEVGMIVLMTRAVQDGMLGKEMG